MYLSSVLFNALLQLTTCHYLVSTVTRTMPDDGGLDTLRLVREEFGRTKRQMAITTLMRIAPQKFGENKFIDQLSRWDFYISEYERVTPGRLPELPNLSRHHA